MARQSIVIPERDSALQPLVLDGARQVGLKPGDDQALRGESAGTPSVS
jgi:hypothetical protein